MLMDESLNGLDQELKNQIIPYIKRVLSEFNVPFMFISHHLDEMQLMTDHVLVVSKGKIADFLTAEALARRHMSAGNRGYANIIILSDPVQKGDLWQYRWGETALILTEPGKPGENTIELSAKDITLFKCHPEASSARNLLPCIVTSVFGSGNRIGVELLCKGKRIISQVVPDAIRELDIKKGTQIVAAIKASAFRRLY
jgi:molybdate transport system ATP-binding protein